MAVTVSGTSITFNDATVQTTAASAPTTATVLAATAGASAGAVGTYAFLSRVAFSNTGTAAGSTVAGSSLRYAGGASYLSSVGSSPSSISGTAPVGTWRAMGQANGSACYAVEFGTLWLRIS